MGQHGLADDVADGEDVLHVRAHLLVDGDEAALVDLHAGGVGADGGAIGPPSHGDEDLVEGVGRRGAGAVEADLEPARGAVARRFADAGHLGAEVDVLERALDPGRQRFDEVGVGAGDELIEQFDDGDPGAEHGEDGAHLEADDPAADHEEPFGDAGELEGAGGVDDPGVVVGEEREGDRFGAGGDDGLAEGDGAAGPVLGGDLELVGGGEPAGAGGDGDLALLGQAGEAAGEAGDDGVLPGPEPVEVDGRVAEGEAVSGHLLRLADDPGGVEEGLGGDAADVEADAAERGPALDQGGGPAEVGGPEGGRVAAGAGPEHEEFGLGHHSTSRRTSSRTWQRWRRNRAASAPSMTRWS